MLKSGIFKDNAEKIEKIIMDDKIEVWMRSNDVLTPILISDIHPMLSGMSQTIKKLLLQGQGISLDKKMVLKWLKGELDPKNSWFLDNVDLFVTLDNRSPTDGVKTQIINVKEQLLK